MPRNDPREAYKDLEKAVERAEGAVRRIGKLSSELSSQSSEALCGTFGGLVGGFLGILLSPIVTIPTLLVTVPLTGIGIVSGILAYRGKRRFRIEKIISENRLAEEEIMRRIEGLPDNAPKQVTRQLWDQYMMLTNRGDRATVDILAPGQNANRLLPPEDERNLRH